MGTALGKHAGGIAQCKGVIACIQRLWGRSWRAAGALQQARADVVPMSVTLQATRKKAGLRKSGEGSQPAQAESYMLFMAAVLLGAGRMAGLQCSPPLKEAGL